MIKEEKISENLIRLIENGSVVGQYDPTKTIILVSGLVVPSFLIENKNYEVLGIYGGINGEPVFVLKKSQVKTKITKPKNE